MVIFNKTKKTMVAKDYRLCRSAGSKARGLMFTNESRVKDRALLFEFRKPMLQSLHMFFVFYPIDVVFLDGKKRVVELKQNFRPFQVYNSRKQAKYVIELPESTIKKSRTAVGDVVKW